MKLLLETLAPIFLTPQNYKEVLRKLAAFMFYEALIATFILRSIPAIDAALDKVETYGPLGEALNLIPYWQHLNLSGIAMAAVIALATFKTQFHDRISDVFGIRRRFDRDNFLLPLAVLVGAHLTPSKLRSIDTHRDLLMRQVFYKYASSRADHPLVDKHDIEHALAAWSWYWIFWEGIALFLACGLIALFFSSTVLSTIFFGLALFYGFLTVTQYRRLERLARPQVETIVGKQNASAEVKKAFDAL